ncbi:MAG: glutamate decarboxylase [Pseudomonadota bacterium]|nr:glutamate decarboxylase [Gammaproteobacteria bacterium]MBU1558303.1 glutamate decarboxylase [Gammaproteobacteria bacterium]MBU1926768.1 glutamate decarboxylase [Gammaproteobacteria bacterium]MBU2546254.1 glutamate decarboxylase [Gammaproteobacteria bacterium]
MSTLKKIKDLDTEELLISTYGSRDFDHPVPKYKIPEKEMPAKHAYSLVHDMLMLDGNSRLNLATFVSTWMEDEARQLMSETFDKNMIDKDEYPQTAEIEMRCVSMLAHLWHCEKANDTIGCSTIGSSEACMLGGLAMKWRWRQRMQAKNKRTDKPNLVMGINVQICWEKFCRYWDIEMRQVPMAPGRYKLNAEEAIKLCDENTIGIIGILGTTFTGEYEPIKEINKAVDKLNAKTGWEIPIHVDAASGGFIAPFLQPKLEWDFRLKWVKSINTSGHKYGLVYPGVGWVVWRDKEELPKDLIFYVNYLGGEMPTFALNFSRPGNQIVAQYYNFLRLGKDGYRRVQQVCQDVAKHLSSSIAKMGPFELLSDGSELPVFCWKLKKPMNFTVFDLSERLRYHGWLIPAYTMPANLEDVAVMRIVVREGLTFELANLLINDIKKAVEHFETQSGQAKQVTDEDKSKKGGFHH